MDFFNPEKQKESRQQHPSRKRLTQDQVRLLEKCFIPNKNLDPERKVQIARELGVPPRQVAIWYQNKRARWKTQSLEIDCNTLQVKLDNVLAEKRQLEKDVERLEKELKKTQEMLMFNPNNQTSFPPPSVISPTSCGDDGGSLCTFNEDMANSSWDDHQHHYQDNVMQLENLYACFMYNENGRRLG